MERSWKKSKPSSNGWIAPHAVHTKNGDASSLLSHDQHFFSNSNTGVLENSLSNFPLVSRLLHYIPNNKPEILQTFSPIVREPWIAWHNKNILVINERWRLNPQNFSNVRETQTHELPDLIEILVINREMEQLEFQIHFFRFQKAYLLSVVWMPGLCKAQFESTFSIVHDALSSSLLNPRKLPLHEEDPNKPVWNLLCLLIPHEVKEEEEEEDRHPEAGRLIHLHSNSRRQGDTDFTAILKKETEEMTTNAATRGSKTYCGTIRSATGQIINYRLEPSWMYHLWGR